MYQVLLGLLLLDGLFLSIVILLQAGKGGGLAAVGGGAAATEGVLAGRQAQTVLTRATWTAGTAFMVLALVLAILSSRARSVNPALRDDLTTTLPTAAPEPILPSADGTPAGDATTPPAGGGDGGGSGNEGGDGNL